jgi:ADP-ribosylglycohydrolase
MILSAIESGVPWRAAAGAAFDGQGSMGNGAAMRAAPIGAWFEGDLDAVVQNAKSSAAPTHAHPDGAAGAVAIALAATLATRVRGVELLRAVVERTPPSATREGIRCAIDLDPTLDATAAAKTLGSGALVCSHDTVPFALFCAAHHATDFEEALWYTVAGLGDRDTTCAMVGGIVALTAPIPEHLSAAREPLPRE